MKKILLTSLIAACASFSLSSCMNGDYDANPAGTASGTNPLTPPSTGGGGGGTSSPSFYSWNGTDPISAKIDGTGYQASVSSAQEVSNTYVVQGSDGSKTMTITFPNTSANGSIQPLSQSSITIVGYTEGADMYVSNIAGGSGSVYIMENDATHVKGKFVATLKAASGATKNITEGYFNVDK